MNDMAVSMISTRAIPSRHVGVSSFRLRQDSHPLVAIAMHAINTIDRPHTLLLILISLVVAAYDSDGPNGK